MHDGGMSGHLLRRRWAGGHPSRTGSDLGFQSLHMRATTSAMTWSKVKSVQDLQSIGAELLRERLFSFGVITDVQYADIPDGHSFLGVPRYYRNSLVALRRAVDSWRRADVDFAIHFGDIVDGFQPRDGSVQAINDVLGALDRLQKPHYHMLGNHCLYNLPRPVLNKMLDIPDADGGGSYYAFSPHPGVRIIVLDGYDISILGWPEGHPHRELAQALLDKHNPSEDKNNPELMEGNGKRFVMFGGGVSEVQLAWLKAELQQAKAGDQTVLVSCHIPLCPGTVLPVCLLWNYEEVLRLLRASGVVAATICGHAHQNGYVLDDWGIHHLVLPAVLETPPGRDAYGVLEVYPEYLVLQGRDTMMSLKMELKGSRRVKAAAEQ